MVRSSSRRPWLTAMMISLVSCSGASSPPAETPEQDEVKGPMNTERACELLTRADAASILASPIEDDADESALTPLGDKVLHGRCYYEGDGGSVSLDVSKHVDAAFAGERFMRLRNRHDSDPSFRAMPDLGEDAFAEHDALHVKRADLILSIDLRRTGERKLKHYGDKESLDTLAAEKRDIAVGVLKRLPPVPGS